MTLFDTLPPSVADSPTSIAAAESIAPNSETLRRRVYDYIRSRGTEGATDAEIQAALAMNGSTERPRRIECLNAGLIRDSGRTRKTESNRQAVVWIEVGA